MEVTQENSESERNFPAPVTVNKIDEQWKDHKSAEKVDTQTWSVWKVKSPKRLDLWTLNI